MKLIEAPFREKTIAVRVQYVQKQLSEIFGFPAVYGWKTVFVRGCFSLSE